MIDIRYSQLIDAKGIARVHVTSWQQSYVGIVPAAHLKGLSIEDREKFWSETLSEESTKPTIYVAEDNKKGIIGFVSGGSAREPDYGYAGELYAIYLLQEFQGQGIGRQLFNRFVTELKKNGSTTMYARTLKEAAAAKFYRAMGGKYIKSSVIERGGKELPLDLYGWKFNESKIPNQVCD